MSKPEAIVFEDGRLYWKTNLTNLYRLPLYFFCDNLCVKSEPHKKQLLITKYNKNNKIIYLTKL
jgi:hypothetical protein